MSQRREVGEDGKELTFDHGAPFFSVTNPNAISLVHEWESLGFVSQWKQVFCSFDSASNMFLGFQQEGDHTNNNKYVGVPGMNSISKTLCNHSDLSHVFASVNRSINFIDHTSDLSWKESQRIKPIVVDPALYLARRTQLFTATEKRPTPDAFKVFTGSPWIVLSRSFLEYCIFGWDNLPRILLMYFNNVILSEECYFHTVICNAPEFSNTTVNGDLRYMIWDSPPKMEPHFLSVSDYDAMAQSGAAFARQFKKDDPVLDMVDREILKRRGRYRVTPGAWCARHGSSWWWTDPCSEWADVNVVKGGPQAKKLDETVTNFLDDLSSQTNQCK